MIAASRARGNRFASGFEDGAAPDPFKGAPAHSPVSFPAPAPGPVMPDVLLCLTTCPDAASAERIAEALVGEQLAACVNRLPGVQSMYRWKGELCREPEQLLLIKTTRVGFEALQARVRDP